VFLDTALAPSLAEDIDYGDFAVRLQMDWKPHDDFLAYASYNRGIKGGNYTTYITAVGDLRHDEEVLNAYEVGFKWSLPDQAMRLNASAFYYDYNDYQAFGLIAAFPVIVNRDAEIWGGEVEFTWTPTEQLDFMAGLSLLDSEITSVPNAFYTLPEVQGTEVPSAPPVSINFLARYTWPIAAFGGGNFALQVDGNYNDDHYLDVFNSEASREEGYFVGNLRASYTTSDEKWKIEAYMKNFTDAEYRLYMLDLALGGLIESVYAPPSWVGGSISYRF
jgi:iron complex outermembrane receptor protein